MAPPTTSQPGRALIALLLFIALIFGGVFLAAPDSLGDDRLSLAEKYKPRLGLDLEGGTQVILEPRVAAGKKGTIDREALARAVTIIRSRVDAFGVAEAEVTTAGDNIVISVPGTRNNEILESVRQTAELRFRPVLVEAAGVPDPAQESPVATPAPDATAPASPTAESSPAPTETTDQRAIPNALRAGESPSPPPAPEAPPQQGLPPGVTPELAQQFSQLDCSNLREVRREIRTKALDEPNKPLVTCSQDGGAKYILGPAEVLGTHIKSANAGLETNQQGQASGGGWQVQLEFNGEGTRKFANVTRRLSKETQPPRNQFAIVLDGLVVSAPTTEYIPNGQAQITGDFSQKEATELANVLKYGALPLTFDPGDVQEVSPTLGGDQLTAGVIAGGIGLLLVVVYSLLYYRGLGLVTVASLIVAGVATYGAVVLLGWQIGFRLSLAGVAGLIVAIGITADSFIVFFERLRDEVRDGKTLRVAVETGWVRARRTILAADFVSFLAAVVLYVLSVGGVRGFAFTLGLTTLIDIVVVFLFTKPLVTLLARTKFFGQGHRLSGFDPKHLGVARPTLTTRPPRRQPATAMTQTAVTKTKEA